MDNLRVFFAGVELYLIPLAPFVCPRLNFAQLIQDYIVWHILGLVAHDREVVRKQIHPLGAARHILRFISKKSVP
jgi:hypothetical protein